MKKIILVGIICLMSNVSLAQMPYIEEIRALGAISGQGMACGATKYDTFEMLARAILISKSPTDALQGKAMYVYNEEKANAYISKQMDGFYGCEEINRRFNAQDIFKAVLYDDGTIQMPDGTIITPRKAYDANFLYKKDNTRLDKAKAIYNGSNNAKIIKVDVKNAEDQKVVQPMYDPTPSRGATPASVPLESSVKRISRKK